MQRGESSAVSYQVEKREKKDPNDIDKVPVQAHDFDRTVVIGRVSVRSCLHDEVNQEAGSDNHVQCVHARHRKVKTEHQLDLPRHRTFKMKPRSRNQVLDILVVILEGLDNQEGEAQV